MQPQRYLCRKSKLASECAPLFTYLLFDRPISMFLCIITFTAVRGAGRVSGQGGQNSAQSAENFFSFAHPGFQFAHPAIRNGCPPCPPYRGGFKGKGLDVGH